MKMMYYKLYLKFKHIPCRGHVALMLDKRPPINALKRSAARGYVYGYKINEIATDLRITRERVRQLLLSIVR